jgi:hypothetical protein
MANIKKAPTTAEKLNSKYSGQQIGGRLWESFFFACLRPLLGEHTQ